MLVQGIRFLPRSFRKLIDFITLWRFNHSDEQRQIKEELAPYSGQQMDEIFRYTFQKKHDFLFMDLAGQRIYRNFNKLIFSDDSNNDSQTATKAEKAPKAQTKSHSKTSTEHQASG